MYTHIVINMLLTVSSVLLASNVLFVVAMLPRHVVTVKACFVPVLVDDTHFKKALLMASFEIKSTVNI